MYSQFMMHGQKNIKFYFLLFFLSTDVDFVQRSSTVPSV